MTTRANKKPELLTDGICSLTAETADKKNGWWMKRKVYSKNIQEYVKDSLSLLQLPSRMLLLIVGYVASAWGREETAARVGSQVLIQAH